VYEDEDVYEDAHVYEDEDVYEDAHVYEDEDATGVTARNRGRRRARRGP